MCFAIKRVMVVVVLLLATSVSAKQGQPKMGPLLNFKGTDPDQHSWQVSVEYLLPAIGRVPQLVVSTHNKQKGVQGRVIGRKFKHVYVRYDLSFTQEEKEIAVSYWLPNHGMKVFYVPAIGHESDPNKLLYYSCNGQQSIADKQKVNGINGIWNAINQEHVVQHFAVGIGGGDQVYSDGVGNGQEHPANDKVSGLFALPTLQPWLADKKNLTTPPFTEEMRREVDKYYFDLYVNHYNEPEFAAALASIPSFFQQDDHETYDGFNSYPKELQNSPIMRGIGDTAAWYINKVQHQLSDDEVPMIAGTRSSYNYVHVLGKIAIVGMDMRTERTEDLIMRKESWDDIKTKMEILPAKVEHVVLMLAVPLVFPSMNKLESIVKGLSYVPVMGRMMDYIPGYKNLFGLFELDDDGRDNFNHWAHKKERDEFVAFLQNYGRVTRRRVTLLSGDVHLGGAGKIHDKTFGIMDDTHTAIYQVISSPVGNVPVNSTIAGGIAKRACFGKSLPNNCARSLINVARADDTQQAAPTTLLSHRNFLTFGMGENSALHFVWSAETGSDSDPHTKFVLDVPRLK